MTQHEGAAQPAHLPDLGLDLTANEYRLLADLLLDYMATNPTENDALSSLAQRLFVLAVQADRIAGANAAD